MTIKIIHKDDTEERVENVLSVAFNDSWVSYSVKPDESISIHYDRDNVRLVVVI